MHRRVSFPYERVLTPIGFVWIPVARVQIVHVRIRLELDMTVDTGADLTMVPHQVGLHLGFRSGRGHVRTLSGIAGGTPYQLVKARLTIGPFRMLSRIAWAQRDDVPMLLGRTDVLDHLITTFDGERRQVTFRDLG